MTTTTPPQTPEAIDVPAGHGLMSTLQRDAGDLRVMWDKNNADEVAAARTQFDSMRKQGFAAYAAEGKHGDRGRVIREFDPEVERIILVKPNQGG